MTASLTQLQPERYLRVVPTILVAGEVQDVALVAAVRNGDERALSLLYDRYAPVVMGVAVRIVGDVTTAETVVLDTFTQAWQDAKRYDAGRASVVSWLVMMARSRALDAVRASARQARVGSLAVEEAPDEALAARDLSSNPGQVVEANERRSAIADALGALPEPQRVAVELAFFEGLSQTEIAERLSEPLGTIKTRIRLAMAKLRQLLSPHGDEALA
ncbi:MAG TPA: sigma-70 family RNA polymerase sigma factor [Gemmatimonadaceae bacterium]|nr:sigma-70 family RNA polymerase sigma factor [Gemmatimonadaceae bacterium]